MIEAGITFLELTLLFVLLAGVCKQAGKLLKIGEGE